MRRRLVVAVTLLSYLLTAVGYPVPTTIASSGQTCCCGTEAQCRSSGCGCSHSPLPMPAKRSCCAKKAPTVPSSSAPICCDKPSTTPKKCCQKSPTDAPAAPAEDEASVRWVVGVSAQKCRGGSTEWVNAQAALPGPLPFHWQPCLTCCLTIPLFHLDSFVGAAEVTDPPPRSHAA